MIEMTLWPAQNFHPQLFLLYHLFRTWLGWYLLPFSWVGINSFDHVSSVASNQSNCVDFKSPLCNQLPLFYYTNYFSAVNGFVKLHG